MKEFLQEQLQKTKYRIIPTDISCISSLFKCNSRAVVILNIVDLKSSCAVTRKELTSLTEELRQLFLSKGYFKIEIRNLLLTPDPEKTEKEWGADDRDWIWALDEHQMYIGERPGPESIALYNFVKETLYSVSVTPTEPSEPVEVFAQVEPIEAFTQTEPSEPIKVSTPKEPSAVAKQPEPAMLAAKPKTANETEKPEKADSPVKSAGTKAAKKSAPKPSDKEELQESYRFRSNTTVIDINDYLYHEKEAEKEEDSFSEEEEDFGFRDALYIAGRLWDIIPVCTILLVSINIVLFLYLERSGSTLDAGFMAGHGGLYAPYVWNKQQWYLLFTSIFLHFGFTHLSNNMLVFAIVGSYLEKTAGKLRFLGIYLLSGLGGSIFSLIQSTFTHSNIVTAGASGAIFGVIGALLLLVILNRGVARGLTGVRIAILLFISLYYGFANVSTDNMSHIGGLITGCLMYCVYYLIEKRREKRRKLRTEKYCLPN